MEKMESLKTMLLGNIAFIKYLYNTFNNRPVSDTLLDLKYLRANKISMINLLLLATKEDMIDDNGNNKVLDEDIKLAVDQIRGKMALINNPTLNTDEEIINFIRNKMGHGDYLPVAEGRRVIINPGDNEVTLNLNAFSKYAMLLSRAYLSLVNGPVYEKEFYNVRIGANERLESEGDIRDLLGTFITIKIKLVNKTGNKISSGVLTVLKHYLADYKRFQDENYLKEAKTFIDANFKDYEYSYSIEPFGLSEREKKRFAHNFASSWNLKRHSNIDIANALGHELTNHLKSNAFNMIASAQTAIILLDAIKCEQSLNKEDIDRFIKNTYGSGVVADQYVFAASMLAAFESSFGYTKDDVFKNFDYSIYDFSLVKPSIMVKGSSINNINEQIAFNSKNIIDEERSIKSLKFNSAQAIMHGAPTDKINANIKKHEEAKTLYQAQLIELNNRLNTINKHDFNKGVIDGIRNAISHNGVTITNSDDLSTCKIKFEDIYEGVKNFECELTFQEFYDLLEKNTEILGLVCDNYCLKLK